MLVFSVTQPCKQCAEYVTVMGKCVCSLTISDTNSTPSIDARPDAAPSTRLYCTLSLSSTTKPTTAAEDENKTMREELAALTCRKTHRHTHTHTRTHTHIHVPSALMTRMQFKHAWTEVTRVMFQHASLQVHAPEDVRPAAAAAALSACPLQAPATPPPHPPDTPHSASTPAQPLSNPT